MLGLGLGQKNFPKTVFLGIDIFLEGRKGMEPSPQFYKKSEFIEMLTGNKVSRKSVLCGSQNIRLQAVLSPWWRRKVPGIPVKHLFFWESAKITQAALQTSHLPKNQPLYFSLTW
jgi:hypothetical protein